MIQPSQWVGMYWKQRGNGSISEFRTAQAVSVVSCTTQKYSVGIVRDILTETYKSFKENQKHDPIGQEC